MDHLFGQLVSARKAYHEADDPAELSRLTHELARVYAELAERWRNLARLTDPPQVYARHTEPEPEQAQAGIWPDAPAQDGSQPG